MTPLDSRRALITYALVSESLDKSNDFLMGLAPIFAAIAEERDGQIFDPKTFSSDAEKLFGLAIPEEVADFLAPRLQKDGVLVRPQSNMVTYVWRQKQVQGAAKKTISTKIDQIVDELVGFALGFPSVSGKTFSREELQDGLFEWLLREDRNVRSAMSALGYEDEDGALPPSLKETIYIAASFIKSIEDRSDDTLATLGEIANSVVVSEALLGVINPPKEDITGTDLTVYLDAPLALDLIGTSGKEKKSYAEEVLAGLRKFGCNIAIFQHSIDELRDNLKAVMSQQNHRYGPTADAMRRNEVDEGFVRRVMNNSEAYVRDLEISIFDPERSRLPANSDAFFDEESSQRLFQLLNVGYASEKARDRDIRSIEIVMKRRAGFRTSMVFKAKHLLVTNNELLSNAAQRLSTERTQHKEYVPPALHRRRMSATLWLQLGSERRRAIARKQLVASCSDVLRIRPEIIEKLRSRLSAIDLQKAEQFDVMIRQPRYQQLAMDLTFSNENIASTTDAMAVFEKIREEMVAAERDRQEAERQRERSEHEAQRALEKNQHRSELDDLQSKVSSAKRSAEVAQEATLNALRGAVAPFFESYAIFNKFATPILVVVILLTFSLGGLVGIVGEKFFGSAAPIVEWSAFAAGGILSLLTLLGRDVRWLKKPVASYFLWRIRARAESCGVSSPITVDLENKILRSGNNETYSLRPKVHLPQEPVV